MPLLTCFFLDRSTLHIIISPILVCGVSTKFFFLFERVEGDFVFSRSLQRMTVVSHIFPPLLASLWPRSEQAPTLPLPFPSPPPLPPLRSLLESSCPLGSWMEGELKAFLWAISSACCSIRSGISTRSLATSSLLNQMGSCQKEKEVSLSSRESRTLDCVA